MQRTVTSQLGAIYISLNVLLALVSGTQHQRNQQTGSAAYEHHEPWILDTCLALWQDFKRWTTGAEKRPFHDEAVSSFLRVVEALVLPSGTTTAQSLTFPKAAQGLVHSLLGILNRSDLSAASQMQLASLIIRLRSAQEKSIASHPTTGRRRTNPILFITDGLESGIAVVCQDQGKFAALHKDLQVCFPRSLVNSRNANWWQSALCLWTAPGLWPLSVADTRQQLCTNESEAFADPRLLEQAQSVLRSFRGLNLSEEDDRPAKRRKTLPDSENGVNLSAYEHLKSVLVGSDGESLTASLSNLHNTVQYVLKSIVVCHVLIETE